MSQVAQAQFIPPKDHSALTVDVLISAAEELRIAAIRTAIPKRDSANRAQQGLYPTNLWTLQMLQDLGELDVTQYIKLNAQAQSIVNGSRTDVTAIRIPQRCCGNLNAYQIEEEERKIGTDNLQQCVAVIAHGFMKSGEEKAILMHVDKYTDPNSIKTELAQFKNDKHLRVIVYGGRDLEVADAIGGKQHSPQAAISRDNISVVTQAIIECHLAERIDSEQSKIGLYATSSNLIYDPAFTKIIEHVYPNGGHEIADATAKIRVSQNISVGRDFRNTNPPVLLERNASLIRVKIQPDGTSEPFVMIEDDLKCKLLRYYHAQGCSEYMKEIEESQRLVLERGNGGLLQPCSSCHNFVSLVQEVLKPDVITLKEIYNKSTAVTALIEHKIALQERQEHDVELRRQADVLQKALVKQSASVVDVEEDAPVARAKSHFLGVGVNEEVVQSYGRKRANSYPKL